MRRWPLGRRTRRRDAPGRAAVADRGLVVGGPAVVAGRPAGCVVTRGALVADPPVVARRTSLTGNVVASPGRRAVFAGRPPRRVVVTSGPGRGVVADGTPGRHVVAPGALVADRRLVGRRHLAGVPVAGRLTTAALGRRLLRGRLAAGRLRGPRRPVTPLRGRCAFAPRTTRTLGW
ncbi:hypothetical protein ACIA5G_09120 [Amycolatopsis sp. NPDC051758]|uniref:hypothetical protein n=1 Tax=Amycolatopsis sp. NPDC051758 TaxID=3363935 RepID=UPI00378B9A57